MLFSFFWDTLLDAVGTSPKQTLSWHQWQWFWSRFENKTWKGNGKTVNLALTLAHSSDAWAVGEAGGFIFFFSPDDMHNFIIMRLKANAALSIFFSSFCCWVLVLLRYPCTFILTYLAHNQWPMNPVIYLTAQNFEMMHCTQNSRVRTWWINRIKDSTCTVRLWQRLRRIV